MFKITIEETTTEEKIVDIYGYPDPVEQEVTETKKIFEQTVEELDLAKVIKAVNNI